MYIQHLSGVASGLYDYIHLWLHLLHYLIPIIKYSPPIRCRIGSLWLHPALGLDHEHRLRRLSLLLARGVGAGEDGWVWVVPWGRRARLSWDPCFYWSAHGQPEQGVCVCERERERESERASAQARAREFLSKNDIYVHAHQKKKLVYVYIYTYNMHIKLKCM